MNDRIIETRLGPKRLSALVNALEMVGRIKCSGNGWVIAESDGPLYWSNEDGWSDLKSATIFDQSETLCVALPFNGEWTTVDYARLNDVEA